MAADNKKETVKTGRRKCSIAVAKVVSGKGRVFIFGEMSIDLFKCYV